MNTEAKKTMELLAPAGEWESLRAAVANGADAVYFGLRGFNARGKAENFGREELAEVMAYLHDRNVRGYVAVNTLAFGDELAEVARGVEALAGAGADAMIVQDLGVAALARRVAPELTLHASTQMSLSEGEGIALARELGISRVILARELSMDQVRSAVREARACGVEAEVFVHGAICISCSGQCLASWARGGRSANRGECAQPCRLEYELIVDRKDRQTEGGQYLLSPGDLSGWRRVGELAAAGVRAVKIEGRLRGAEYVAAVTRAYREAIDAEGGEGNGTDAEPQAREGVEGRKGVEGTGTGTGSGSGDGDGKRRWEPGAEVKEGLEQVYGRRMTEGFLGGASWRELVDGGDPARRGREAGVVRAVSGAVVTIETRSGVSIAAGDGMAFGQAEGGAARMGGRVYSVRPGASGRVEVKFASEGLDVESLEPGMRAWKTDDPAVGKRLRASFARVEPWRRVSVSVRVEARAGEPLAMEFVDAEGVRVRVVDEQVLEQARNRPTTAAWAREQLDRLGETPLALGAVELVGPAGPTQEVAVMVPASAFNRVRRRAVEELTQRRRERARTAARADGAIEELRKAFAREDRSPTGQGAEGVRISVVGRTLEQVEAACAWGGERNGVLDAVYADLADVEEWARAMEAARRMDLRAGLATPRMVLPGQEWVWDRIVEARPDVVRVRSLGALRVLRARLPEAELVADFSLNAVNDLSAGVLARWGARGLVVGFDAQDAQAAAMLEFTPASMIEARAYGRVPLFYTRYCLYAAHANGGADCARCSRPCRKHEVTLRDRRGQELPVTTDAVGGNCVYAEAEAEKPGRLRRWLEAGVRRFCVELTREGTRETREALDVTREVVSRRI